MEYKVGIGYDIHRLVKGRRFVLGGIKIPSSKGLLGHSDADALLHAIADALLGAAGLGDIGEHFPDTDPKHKGADSAELLKKLAGLLKKKGCKINNVDTIIIAEEPKLSAYKPKMRERIAKTLGINKKLINIKAKTNEGLGEVGAKKAIACWAVATLTS